MVHVFRDSEELIQKQKISILPNANTCLVMRLEIATCSCENVGFRHSVNRQAQTIESS